MTLRPEDMQAFIRDHFSNLSETEFVANVGEFCRGMNERALFHVQTIKEEAMEELTLFQRYPTSLGLDAYLACALTGLAPDQKQLVVHLSDMVAVVCREHGIEVYEPRKKTDPVHHPHVQDTDVFWIDRERVLNSDLLIVLSHFPSFGAGEELDFAYGALVPILIISHSDTRVSRMVTGIPSFKIHLQYDEPEELRLQLKEALIKIRPILEQRKMAFSKYDTNLVGERVRLLREEAQLTREELADKVVHLSEEALAKIEGSPDRVSNLSLLQLRQIATVLKTTVADLVEPDPSERLMALLQDWVDDRSAARFGGISMRDRNKLLRRVLLRVIDSLEKDE